MAVFAIKLSVNDGEKPETKQFLVKCETYGRAEEMAYIVAESLGFKEFKVESVVKTQIKEVQKDLDPDDTMWLVKYEFGLEAKPSKSNFLVSGKSMSVAHTSGFAFLDPLCDSLFITGINKTEFMDFVEDEKAEEDGDSPMLNFVNSMEKQGIKMTISHSNVVEMVAPELIDENQGSLFESPVEVEEDFEL